MFDTRIPLYGIFIIIAILCGLLVIYRNANYLNMKKEETFGLLLYIALGAVFGAKYFTFFTNFSKYNGMFEFSKIGLSSYGAIMGILILLFLFSKQYKKKFKDLVYVISPAIPLMYGIGKIGCFLAGCCYGIEYNGPLRVIYKYSYSAPNGVGLFPVQLLEAIVFILIFIHIFYRSKIVKEKIIPQTFIFCGIAKFLLDYLRVSHFEKVFTLNQIVSLFFVFIGLYLLFNDKKKY